MNNQPPLGGPGGHHGMPPMGDGINDMRHNLAGGGGSHIPVHQQNGNAMPAQNGGMGGYHHGNPNILGEQSSGSVVEGDSGAEGQEVGDEALLRFMGTLQNYEPMIPDEVSRHFVNKGGVDTDDTRILRLFSVVTQKFVSDIVVDALAQAKLRNANTSSNQAAEGQLTLTASDLNQAMQEYGVPTKKPPYYG